jgi:hypothetical protein
MTHRLERALGKVALIITLDAVGPLVQPEELNEGIKAAVGAGTGEPSFLNAVCTAPQNHRAAREHMKPKGGGLIARAG